MRVAHIAKKLVITAICGSCLHVSSTAAQEIDNQKQCGWIVNSVNYDYSKTFTSRDAYNVAQASYCSSEIDTYEKAQTASASGGYDDGLLSINAGGHNARTEFGLWKNEFCKESFLESYESEVNDSTKKAVNLAVLEVLGHCMNLVAHDKGLSIRTYIPDGTREKFFVETNFSPLGTDLQNVTLKSSSDTETCAELKTTRQIEIGTHIYSCKRNPKKSYNVVLNTGWGAFQRDVPADDMYDPLKYKECLDLKSVFVSIFGEPIENVRGLTDVQRDREKSIKGANSVVVNMLTSPAVPEGVKVSLRTFHLNIVTNAEQSQSPYLDLASKQPADSPERRALADHFYHTREQIVASSCKI